MADRLTINGLSEEDFLDKYCHDFSTVEEKGLDWWKYMTIIGYK